jgi:hypothetical protein
MASMVAMGWPPLSRHEGQVDTVWTLFHLPLEVTVSLLYFYFVGTKVCTCKAGALPLESHLPFILLWLLWRWGSMNYLPRWS